ncbi:MAG: hypothetical protein Tsb0026_15940 [Sulfuricaulis sp.]
MPTKNLKELRALARSRGLQGYSKLSRSELEKFLSRDDGQKPVVMGKTGKAAPKKTVAGVKSKSVAPRTKKKHPAIPAARATAPTAPAPALTPKWEWATDISRQPTDEEQIENAKYAIVPPGATVPRAEAADLNEDIDNLPPVTEPTLCLLPQKPGVLHGYWIIPPSSLAHPRSLKLRLGRLAGDAFEIIDELALSHERGHWYFHVGESADTGAVYLQLGYYEPNGRFVIAIRRGIARIPSLHASDHTDRLWWVSEEKFRTMYRRAGGYARGPRLGWAASISSPGGAPSSDRLARPGNVSNR